VKLLGWILAFLIAVGVLLAVPVIALRTRPWPDCTGRVLIVRGPHGQPLECVCIRGTLSTCFNPGP